MKKTLPVILCSFLLAACNGASNPGSGGGLTCEEQVAKGKEAYNSNCQLCHGSVPNNGNTIWQGDIANSVGIDLFDSTNNGYKKRDIDGGGQARGINVRDFISQWMPSNANAINQSSADAVIAYLTDTVGRPWCPGDPEIPGGSGSGSSSSSSSSSGNTIPPVLGTKADAPANGRRLTLVEYVNTINDIFDIDTTDIEERLISDSASVGMRNSFEGLKNPDRNFIDAYEAAAELVVNKLSAQKINQWANCNNFNRACTEGFIKNIGNVLYRGKFEDRLLTKLLGLFELARTERGNFTAGAKLVIQAILQSPDFLYRLEQPLVQGTLAANDIASRFAFAIWYSAPDKALLDRADSGGFDKANINATVKLMLDDPRAKRGVRAFISEWLQLYRLQSRTIDPVVYPNFRDQVKPAMTEETFSFFEQIIFSEKTSFMSAFTRQKTNFSREVSGLYGLNKSGNHDWSGDRKRIGFLTQAAVLSVHTIILETSIVDRGLFVAEDILCREIGSPSGDLLDLVNETFAGVDPTLPQRARFAQHNSSSNLCGVCHDRFDGLGYVFEAYDGISGFMTEDAHNNPIALDGSNMIDQTMYEYRDVTEFAHILEKSYEAKSCLVEKALTFYFGRLSNEKDHELIEHLVTVFDTNNQDFLELIKQIATTDAFLNRVSL